MLQQLRTFAWIKSYILKGTINDYFCRTEQHCAYCIRSLKYLCLCVCVCVPGIAASRVTQECIWSQSQWSFLSGQLAWRGSQSWSWLNKPENQPKNTFWPVNLPLTLCACFAWNLVWCLHYTGPYCYLTSCISVAAGLQTPVVPIDITHERCPFLSHTHTNTPSHCQVSAVLPP